MSDYARRLSLGKGYNGGTQVTVYGDSYEDLVNTLTPVYGADGAKDLVNSAFLKLAGEVGSGEQQAVQNLQAAGLVSAPPVSTVGQPLPTAPAVALPPPVAVPQQQAAPLASVPPATNYPGDCVHGARQYKNTAGKNGPWVRWECAVPWSRGAQGRCQNIDA